MFIYYSMGKKKTLEYRNVFTQSSQVYHIDWYLLYVTYAHRKINSHIYSLWRILSGCSEYGVFLFFSLFFSSVFYKLSVLNHSIIFLGWLETKYPFGESGKKSYLVWFERQHKRKGEKWDRVYKLGYSIEGFEIRLRRLYFTRKAMGSHWVSAREVVTKIKVKSPLATALKMSSNWRWEARRWKSWV